MCRECAEAFYPSYPSFCTRECADICVSPIPVLARSARMFSILSLSLRTWECADDCPILSRSLRYISTQCAVANRQCVILLGGCGVESANPCFLTSRPFQPTGAMVVTIVVSQQVRVGPLVLLSRSDEVCAFFQSAALLFSHRTRFHLFSVLVTH